MQKADKDRPVLHWADQSAYAIFPFKGTRSIEIEPRAELRLKIA